MHHLIFVSFLIHNLVNDLQAFLLIIYNFPLIPSLSKKCCMQGIFSCFLVSVFFLEGWGGAVFFVSKSFLSKSHQSRVSNSLTRIASDVLCLA